MHFDSAGSYDAPTVDQIKRGTQVPAGPEERDSPIIEPRNIVVRRQPVELLYITQRAWQGAAPLS